VGLGYHLDDGEAEAGPRLGRGVARLEDLLAFVGRDAGAVILDVKARPVLERADPDADAVAAVDDGVADEVLEQFPEPVGVGVEENSWSNDRVASAGATVSHHDRVVRSIGTRFSAAIPEDVATAPTPPSRAASRSSRTASVEFISRE
jgi:hypothetical protein